LFALKYGAVATGPTSSLAWRIIRLDGQTATTCGENSMCTHTEVGLVGRCRRRMRFLSRARTSLQALEHLHGLYGIQRAHRHHQLVIGNACPGYRSRLIRDNYRDAMAHAAGILLGPSTAPACASWIVPRARVNVLPRTLGYFYVEWHCGSWAPILFHEHMAPPRIRTEPHRSLFGGLGDHLATITLNLALHHRGRAPSRSVPDPRSSRTRRSNCLASPSPQFLRVRASSR
jgi:hypothetical protein